LKTSFFILFPSPNKMVERLHRQMKAAIKGSDNENWVASLPSVLMGIRCAIKDELGASPSELVYRSTIRLPGEFITVSTSRSTLPISDF
jgi:cleavage and polyadenylation specificity factor subunit 1